MCTHTRGLSFSQSLTILEQTKAKKDGIDENARYIDERLAELEDEKEELSRYQSLDKKRYVTRCVASAARAC